MFDRSLPASRIPPCHQAHRSLRPAGPVLPADEHGDALGVGLVGRLRHIDLDLPLHEGRHYVKAFKGRVAYISPADIAPNIIATPCPVNHIIFPQYTGTSQPKITKIPRSKAAMELARQAFNRGIYNQQAFDIFANIVLNADCYQLEAGDINTTCRLIDSVID